MKTPRKQSTDVIHPTRFAGLGYRNDAPSLWRFVDLSDKERPASVGPQFRTKEELLADLPRYAEAYGGLLASSAPAWPPMITITVDPKRLGDLLCCAFGGGVGYWCRIEEKIAPTGKFTPWSEDGVIYSHIDYPLSGGALKLSDSGTPEKAQWTLDRAAILRGLELFPKVAPNAFGNWLAENEDAGDGDTFVQLCLFGEVVYG